MSSQVKPLKILLTRGHLAVDLPEKLNVDHGRASFQEIQRRSHRLCLHCYKGFNKLLTGY